MPLTNGFCYQHKGPFQYEMVNNRDRRICAACLKANGQRDDARRIKRWKKQPAEDRSALFEKSGLERLTRAQVGQILGLKDGRNVKRLELNALAKLRHHPKARAIIALLNEGAAAGMATDPSEELLDYQLEVAEWTEKLEAVVESPKSKVQSSKSEGQGPNCGVQGPKSEGLVVEFMGLIEKCQKLLGRELKESFLPNFRDSRGRSGLKSREVSSQ